LTVVTFGIIAFVSSDDVQKSLVNGFVKTMTGVSPEENTKGK
jgi:hypothetical protein